MMTMIATATKLDWQGWLLGLMGALISGGAGAIGSGFGSIIVDPKDFNLMQGGLKQTLVLMGVTFAFSGIVSLAKFLQQHPVPQVAPMPPAPMGPPAP